MGKNNRARRAAKAKKRRTKAPNNRPSQFAGGSGGWGPHGPGCSCDPLRVASPGPSSTETTVPITDAEAMQRLNQVVRAAFTDDRGRAFEIIDSLMANASTGQIDRVADAWLNSAIHSAWQNGWQPVDLVEYARRRLPDDAVGLVIDAIANEAQQYAPATLHARWASQLDELGAHCWWQSDEKLVGAWAAHRVGDRPSVLLTATLVVGTLRLLPPLERTLPLPGEVVSARRSHRGEVDERVLGRIRALLAKAESTDYPEEAEALSAKAQHLMTKFSLDHALVQSMGDEAQTTVTARRIWLERPYVSAKSTLVSEAARANRCRTVLAQELGFVSVVGDEVDLRLVEVLATSLLVQASRAMLARGSQRTVMGSSRTRSYRQSFLVSYAARIGERLRAAADAGRAELDDEARLLPVLAAKDAQVEEEVAKLFPHTKPLKVSTSNMAGWRDGRVAADAADLDVRRSVGQHA